MSARHKILVSARRSLVALAVALVLTLGVFLAARYLADQATDQILQLQQQEAEGEADLEKKQLDTTSLQNGIAEFETLRQQGMVGLPEREAWVEQLIASRERLNLPNTLTYILQSPQPLTQQVNVPAEVPAEQDGVVETVETPLFHDLEFQMIGIHEDELLALLRTYYSQVKGRFRVNSCSLSAPLENGLTANCTLRFFTLPVPSPKPATP